MYHSITFKYLLPADSLRHWYYGLLDIDFGNDGLYVGFYGGIGKKIWSKNRVSNIFIRGMFGYDEFADNTGGPKFNSQGVETKGRRIIASGVGIKGGIALKLVETSAVYVRVGYDYKRNNLGLGDRRFGDKRHVKNVDTGVVYAGIGLNFGWWDKFMQY